MHVQVRPQRLAAAFFLAPIMPIVLDWLIEVNFDSISSHANFSPLLWFAIGGYGTVLAVGVPSFLLLKEWLTPSLVNSALVGGCICLIPWSLPSIILSDWNSVPFIFFITFLPGMVGGTIFWVIAMKKVRVF